MAQLRVLSLSDSFATLWPSLAESHGLTLVDVTEAGALQPHAAAVNIVVAAGHEHELEALLSQVPRGNDYLVVIGSLADHRIAVEVIRAGAIEYFALPGDLPLLQSWLGATVERMHAAEQATEFAAGENARYRFDGILGDSPALRVALERAARVIPRAGITVLITGETGTGKELLARAIHYNGPRRDAPFVDLNCAAIPEQLLESELFGHEKGAFTGASAAKPGLMELANGGTLFLDEIGHLALGLQGKLLRALEERAIRRVGGTRTIPVDVRIVAATHVELREAVRKGEFRQDLYYRLNVVPIELPALRDRVQDIAPLARHFIDRFAREYGTTAVQLTADAEHALRSRSWEGNVRELRNAVERAVVLADGPTLDARDFDEPLSSTRAAGELPFPATMSEITRAAAERMLAVCGGNKTEAARRLSISRPRLLRLLSSTADERYSDDETSSDA
ncbi:MAG TPA: sigma 54-interacting transcriptional regulator [Gemmatimonadaceae bacterium]